MDIETTRLADSLEMARRLHSENVTLDSLCPTFTSEMVLTPAMVDLARSLQSQGKTRSGIRAGLANYLVENVAKDPATRDAYVGFWDRAGITGASTTLYDSYPPGRAWEDVLHDLALSHRLIDGLGGTFLLGTTASVIDTAHREGKHSVIFNLQSAEPINDDFGRVDLLYNLGVRIIQIAYNLRNRFGDGCVERRDGGLSRFGQALVEKLNERRVLIDLSHCSDQTGLDVIEESSAPVAFTHTAARTISGHARAKTDQALRAIAEKGGYIGVLIVPFFILPPDDGSRTHKTGLPQGWATLDAVVDHIVHILDVAGTDAVGIGTDWGKPYYTAMNWAAGMVTERSSGFDWVGWRPQDRFDPNLQTDGLVTWDQWPNLTAAMLRRGVPEATVAKVIGGNFLRVFREVCG